MRILYLHGFGSRYDSESDKVKSLQHLGKVFGVDLDYTKGAEHNIALAKKTAESHKIDLIVGTSMGGWLASKVATLLGIPFVAVNPCVDPDIKLQKYLGIGVDHHGREFIFTAETCAGYDFFELGGKGIILLDEGDEVIDYLETVALLSEHYDYAVFEGGNHRFEHMQDALDIISGFVKQYPVYGVTV